MWAVWEKLKNYLEEWRYQLFYFTFYAGYMPLLLYLPVYLKHVGLSAVHVGILNGLRPILQSLVTPVLVIFGEKLRSKKLLFVLSCMIAVSKILIMYLLIRPQRQLCIISVVNQSDTTVMRADKLVHVSLLVTDNWSVEEHILNKRIAKREINGTVKTTTTEKVSVSDEFSDHPAESGGENKDFILNLIREHEGGNRNIRIPNLTSNKKGAIHLKFKIRYNHNEVFRIFVSLVFLTILADPFIATIFTLVDYSCAARTAVGKGYSEVRLCETIGWGTMTPIIGLVIYKLSGEMCGIMVETFHYVFFFFIAFISIALFLGIQIDFSQDIPEVISSRIHSADTNLQHGMFSIISAFAGFGHGFLFTFVNWFIDNLGGNTVIMGVATTSKSIVDIILYFQLGNLIEKLGYVYTVSLGLIGHIIVFIMYYGITNAWVVILAEAIYGIVYGSMMSTCASFLVKVAPAGSSARMQAIFHGIYWGIGMAAGCILAGYHLNMEGFPSTFVTFACITVVVTLIFLAVQMQMFLRADGKEMRNSSLDESSDGDSDGLVLDDENKFR